MRILHVLDHSLPLQSGYVYRTMGILREQRNRGWETFHLTTPKHYVLSQSLETLEGFEFWRTRPLGKVLRRTPVIGELALIHRTEGQISMLIEKHRPDIIHAHSPVLNAMATLRANRNHNIPIVYEVRSFWEDAAVQHGTAKEHGPRYRATRYLESKVFEKVDAITVISEGLQREILRRGIAAEKIVKIPNAVDTTVFKPSDQADRELKHAFGLGGSVVLGFVGSFYSYEGLDVLLGAVSRLLVTYPELRVLLVGGGPDEPRLKTLVKQAGLENCVVFAGRVPHEEVVKFYDVIDILVYPRRTNRLTELVTPLKPLEAMAQMRLVVASDVGGHRELIDDGKTGYLFRANDPVALAQRLLEVLADRSAWPRICRAGRQFIEQERTWSNSVAGYEAVYEKLCRRRS